MAPEDTKSKWIKAATVLGVASILGGAFYVAVKDTRDRSKAVQVQNTSPTSSNSLCETVELVEGIYRGTLYNGELVEYYVDKNASECRVWLVTSKAWIFDYECFKNPS